MIIYHSLIYLKNCIEFDVTWNILKTQLNYILIDIILYNLCIDEDGLKLWEDYPEEYNNIFYIDI